MVTDKQFSGWWEILFKINQVIIPFFIGWAVWVTGNIFDMRNYIDNRPKTVSQEIRIMEKDIKSWTSENYASLIITTDIKQMKTDLSDLKTQMAVLNFQLMQDNKAKENKR